MKLCMENPDANEQFITVTGTSIPDAWYIYATNKRCAHRSSCAVRSGLTCTAWASHIHKDIIHCNFSWGPKLSPGHAEIAVLHPIDTEQVSCQQGHALLIGWAKLNRRHTSTSADHLCSCTPRMLRLIICVHFFAGDWDTSLGVLHH